MSNLLTLVQNYFSADLIKKAAQLFGEKEDAVQKIINVGIPSVLNGIRNKAKIDNGHTLLKMANRAADLNMLQSPESVLKIAENTVNASVSDDHNSWLSMIFGKKSDTLSQVVSAYTGAKQSSTKSILNSIAPVCLSFIGSHVKSNNFSAGNLSGWLQGQKHEIKSALPYEESFNAIWHEHDDYSKTKHIEKRYEEKKSSFGWLLWLLLALVAAALCWYLMRGCNKPVSSTTGEVHLNDNTPKTNESNVPVTRESLKVKLANGVEIEVYKGGIEDKLVKCLDDKDCLASKDMWYDFDNLNFRAGSDSLTDESMAQVTNIVAMLKAYPKAKIKIGGYADKSGDSTISWQLSEKRAKKVFSEIKAQGADSTQVSGFEGYGWQFAKYPSTAPEEDRRKDRRISLQLNEK